MINTGEFYRKLVFPEQVCPYCNIIFIWEDDKDMHLVTRREEGCNVYDSWVNLYAKCPNCGKEICVS